MAKQPNQSQAGTNIQEVRQQNAQSAQAGSAAGQGQFGTEFASETNAQEVRQQNARSAQAGSAAGQGQFGAEFASETNAQEVRSQSRQAEARKSQNAGRQ